MPARPQTLLTARRVACAMRRGACGLAALGTLLLAGSAVAADGRLLGSAGLLSLDGSGGGGISSWALLSGHAGAGEHSLGAGLSFVRTGDFDLAAVALSSTWDNRLEVSLGSQWLDLQSLVEQGASSQADLRLDSVALKWRLHGDPLYARHGQFSLGLKYSRNADFALARQAGAERSHGVDAYLAWSRLWLDGPWHRPLLLNATVRASAAHQTGLLGFDRSHRVEAEGAAALLLSPHWLLGAEYRSKPDRLDFAREEDWASLFLAYLPNKRWQLALALVDLGEIGGLSSQRGVYLTVQRSD